ncbi:MAG: GerMN domain-containing protein, partial [Actinomycetota bacterium]|nr:GerMN domain-containing protein [Actinomycetota bacterium]
PVLRKIPSVDLKVTDLINELTADLLQVERQANLSTTVPIGLSLAGVTQDNDLAIINFNAGGLEVIEGDELAKALAQIVWTLTETGDLDSIIISIEGEIKTWPTPNSGDQQLLRRIQFMSYAPEVTLGITG